MSAFLTEKVLTVHHWTDRLFSFTTTRDMGLRFSNGHFTMIGLRVDGKPLLRAYSIVSPNYEEHLEFFSIKVPDGPLTSRLQHIQPGDEIIVGRKPTGTLVVDYLRPGRRLYMLATGTGLAPFLSIVRDPEVYERFEQVVIVHGVRQVAELAYRQMLTAALPQHEFLGVLARVRPRGGGVHQVGRGAGRVIGPNRGGLHSVWKKIAGMVAARSWALTPSRGPSQVWGNRITPTPSRGYDLGRTS